MSKDFRWLFRLHNASTHNENRAYVYAVCIEKATIYRLHKHFANGCFFFRCVRVPDTCVFFLERERDSVMHESISHTHITSTYMGKSIIMINDGWAKSFVQRQQQKRFIEKHTLSMIYDRPHIQFRLILWEMCAYIYIFRLYIFLRCINFTSLLHIHTTHMHLPNPLASVYMVCWWSLIYKKKTTPEIPLKLQSRRAKTY